MTHDITVGAITGAGFMLVLALIAVVFRSGYVPQRKCHWGPSWWQIVVEWPLEMVATNHREGIVACWSIYVLIGLIFGACLQPFGRSGMTTWWGLSTFITIAVFTPNLWLLALKALKWKSVVE